MPVSATLVCLNVSQSIVCINKFSLYIVPVRPNLPLDMTLMVHKIILQSIYDLLSHVLLSEAWFSSVLDSGATSTACGRLQFDKYMKRFSKEDKSKVLLEESSKPFRFGDGKQFVSSTAAIMPTNIDKYRVSIRIQTI